MAGLHCASAWACGLALLMLSACAMPGEPPEARPEARPTAETQSLPERARPSDESRALARHYRQLEADLRRRGLMRTDGGGPDTPYGARDLARNFERIVFFDEYAPGGGLRPSRQDAPGALRKWTDPVRVSVAFGANVPATQRRADRREVARYVGRLARVTGHPITMSDDAPNLHVLIMTQDDLPEMMRRIRQIEPQLDTETRQMIRTLPRSIHCFVAAFSDNGNEHAYTSAIAVIRAEHPPLTRQACIHEEIAQGLGLANDSPRARPSIFNDDDEFALLTSHDEELLRLLYDPALSPGMSVDAARPIIRRLLASRPGPS